jgi:hypothetical protein
MECVYVPLSVVFDMDLSHQLPPCVFVRAAPESLQPTVTATARFTRTRINAPPEMNTQRGKYSTAFQQRTFNSVLKVVLKLHHF